MLLDNQPDSYSVSYGCVSTKWINKKSVKRGNDVYIQLLQEKFKPILESTQHKNFFSTAINEDRKRIKKTSMLYITGTCEHAITGTVSESWHHFGRYWNRYITRLRDIFGRSAYIRTWQSQENGYPHFHALVYFFNYQFTVIQWKEENGKTSWRIHNKQKVVIDKRSQTKDYCRDVIKQAWPYGSIDVKCVDDSKKALTDLLKYVTRDLEGGSSDLTNAMVWYFGKRSFAISNGFYKLFKMEKTSVEPTDDDLINGLPVIQEVTQEDKLISIDIFPTIPRELMPFYTQLNLDRFADPPDPPPETIEFLETFAYNCAISSSKKREDGVTINIYKFKENDFD